MSLLLRLRGQPLSRTGFLGRVLTLYKQGTAAGLLLFVAVLLLYKLAPWSHGGASGELVQGVVCAIGFYLAAALMASLTPPDLDADAGAAKRWL